MKITRTVGVVAMIMSIGLMGSGCSSSESSSPSTSATTLTVGAASSLTDVFSVIGAAFTEANPDIDVTFSFAASSALAEQIRGGAPLDVFASAGKTSMEPMVTESLVTDVNDFATNSLQIATPPGNPAGITGLADLPGAKVVVCEDQVPCGVAAQKLFEANSLAIAPVSFEPDVRSVLAKIETDEADAGIVYVTDVKAAGDKVVGVTIPLDQNVTTALQAAVVAASPHAEAAAKFVAFLTSPEAQAALADAGFAPAA